MGLISDFTDAIMDSIKNLLSDAISSSMSCCKDLLVMGLKPNSGEMTGLFDKFLYQDPSEFTGSDAADATKVWDIIQSITDNAVVPIAGGIFGIFVVYDLIYMVMQGNNFREFDSSIFIKWILKTVCGIILISNITYITMGLLSIGTTVASAANTVLFGSDGFVTDISTPSVGSLSKHSIGYLCLCWLVSGFINIGVIITLAFIIVTLASRIIEIFMYVGVSPIAFVSFANTETKQTGQNWLRNILALSFQGLFISIALGIFLVLFNNFCKNIGSMMSMTILLGFTIALLFTVLRSGQISKSIFNAH